MLRTIGCVLVFCLLQVQCAGYIKVMPEYKKINVEGSMVGIILLKESMTIRNPDDVFAHLGDGESIDVFYDFFTSQFREFALHDGKFDDVGVVGGCDTSGFRKSTRYLSTDDSLQVRLPLNQACTGDSVPFLLILDNFDISRDLKPGTTVVTTGPNGTMGTRKVGACDNLINKGSFVLWDNSAGKIVSFGRINEKADALTGMNKQTWISIVEKISSKIFSDTPYGMPSVPTAE